MFPKEGKLSLGCFLISISLILLPVIEKSYRWGFNARQNIWWLLPLYYLILIIYLRLIYSGFLFHVGIRSTFLGGVFSVGVFIISYSTLQWKLFGLYMCVMSFFHYSEFIAIAWCNPETLSISSFLLNHSTPYKVAAMASWFEFALEMFLIPDIKNFYLMSWLGFLFCVIGEVIRKIAMITTNTNFTHIVQTTKNRNHKLITHGIYGIWRHPSYVGWFYWSIGTQILLLNPICTIAYAIVSWKFFNERIIHEEQTLLYFFGEDYVEYQKTVGTGLPGIKGFLIDELHN